MIRHIVMWKLKAEAEGSPKSDNAEKIRTMIEGLKDVVPGIISISVNSNSQAASQLNYDVVLISDHESMEALQSYQIHPEHQKVGAFVKSVVEARSCVDYEI